jgi:hypothetical protein
MTSCGDKHSSIRDYLKNADSASIAFFYEGDRTVQIIIRDKISLEKLCEMIDGKSLDPLKCSETGSIWFYEGGKKKMQVDFSINPECNNFSYMMNDKLYSKIMTDEASEYIKIVKQIATESL